MVAFLSGAVLTAANLNSAFNALTFRAVTGTSDTFVLADNGGAVSYSNASPITATVPPFSSVAYANGTVIQLLNLGAGVVTVTAGAGVTLNGSSVAIAQNTGGTLIKTATNTWYFLPSASAGAGMDLINPTSVAGSGVTLSGGLVTFTAATGVSVNGCFSGSYDNYLISMRHSWADTSGNPFLDLRMRLSGTDATGSNYQYVVSTAFSSLAVQANSTGATVARLLISADVNAALGGTNINMFAPFLAQRTSMIADGETPYSATANRRIFSSADHSLATSYDGFTLLPSASTVTGTLRIYGLRN